MFSAERCWSFPSIVPANSRMLSFMDRWKYKPYDSYLGVPSEQLTVNYNQTGIVSLQFGNKLQVKPDSIGRLAINYRGPERTYPYYSIVDVVQRKLPAGTFKDKIVLVGASATGIGDLRTPPVWRHHLSRSRSSRQRHR